METQLKETSFYNADVIEGDAAPHNVNGKTKRDFLSFKLDPVLQLVGNWYEKGIRQEGALDHSVLSVNKTAPRLDCTDQWLFPA